MASPHEPKKNLGGRPLKFKTPKELEQKIEAYFKKCDRLKEPYTITGLAVELDTSRETLLDYRERDEFSDSITRAKLRFHAYAEKSLWMPKVATGVIFNLKNNYGWKDRSEHDVTSGGKEIQGLAYLPERHGLETDTEAS